MQFEGVNINTGQRSEGFVLGSPVGGLNVRDSITDMPPTDAIEMDNVFPGTSTCNVRRGCIDYVDDVGHPVVSLAVYSATTSERMLAFGGGKATDVSFHGIADELRNDLAGSEVSSCMFGTVADNAQFLIMVTGFDTPFCYNGTSLSNLTITGTHEPPTNFHCVCPYQGRLFFGARSRLGFYYLAPGAIQGAAQYFDLSQKLPKGGALAAIATYSQDAGDGPDDYILFITTKGEYALYRGIDPDNANNWDLVGVYAGPEPIGRKCVAKYGPDVAVLTVFGAVQFSQIQSMGDTKSELTAITAKLGTALSSRNYLRDTIGWSVILYPLGQWLMVTTPDTPSPSSTYSHFVMNTITNAWCRFYSRAWDGISWAIFNGRLYFGTYDGAVRMADEGFTDAGADIPFSVRQAYNVFGYGGQKQFKWAEVWMKSESPVSLSSRMTVDYMDIAPESVVAAPPGDTFSLWDVPFWDSISWSNDAYTQKWTAPYASVGTAGSVWIRGMVGSASVEWFNTKVIFEKMEGLL